MEQPQWPHWIRPLRTKFADLLRGLSLEPEVLAWVIKALRESQRDEKRFHEQALARLQAELAQPDKRLEEEGPLRLLPLHRLPGKVPRAVRARVPVRD